MKNRIHNAINRFAKALEGEDSSKLKELSKKLDMTIEEHARTQNLKSIAQLEGTITLEEANTIYNILGTTVGHFNAQSLAAKVAVTSLVKELLAKHK